VNIERLSKQLINDFVTNPKKAILLGILIAVGLFFWLPAFWGWIRKDTIVPESSAVAQTMVNASPTQTIAGENTIDNNGDKSRHYSWKASLKLMRNDPRTRPAGPLTITHDPFHVPKEEIVHSPTEDQAKPQEPISPASLGMVLSSTLIGPNGAIARIGGKTYNRGQIVKVEKEGRHYEFIVTEIHDRRVQLETEGKSFQLTIPEPTASSHMVLGTVEK
jgi:hypothetical protein